MLAQFKRGDCDGIKVRLGRLQEFLSSACVEHLDFLNIDPEDNVTFRPFQEMDMEKHFRSFTDLPKISQQMEDEGWIDYQV